MVAVSEYRGHTLEVALCDALIDAVKAQLNWVPDAAEAYAERMGL